MSQTILKSPLERSNSDNTESDRSFPPSKRLCNSSSTSKLSSSSSNIEQIASEEQKITNGCQLCGRLETRLLQINCPSLHNFCVNCIFSGTQDHIQNNTAPKCLVTDCEYSLETKDLETLPISVRDYQILSKLIELPVECINKNPENLRVKCDKCHLYIDQYNFYLHHNECAGREATLPCETCFCPVLLTDYSEHFLICQNENQATLVQFLMKHVQDPSANEQKMKSFVKSWQRKSRRSIDVYEIIEEFNQSDGLFEPICDGCKLKVSFDQYHIVNCTENHAICLPCYEQHIKDQVKNGLILTCSQCNYHLQDKDLAEIRTFSSAQIQVCQNYQDRKVFESYQLLFDDDETNPAETTSQPNYPRRTVTSSSSSTGNLNGEEQSRRKCERCLKFWSYEDIFVLHCDCKICYDCFEDEMNEQRTKNTLLGCPFCRRTVDHNDLGNLRLRKEEIQSIQVYQQSRLFEMEHSNYIERSRGNEQTNASQTETDHDDEDPNADLELLLFTQKQLLPKYWELPMLTNFSRHLIDQESAEYKFVSDRFFESWNRMPITALQPPPALRPPGPSIPSSQHMTLMNPSLAPPYFLPVPPVPYRGPPSSIAMSSSLHPVNIPTVNNQPNPSASSSSQSSNSSSMLPVLYSSRPNNTQPISHFRGQPPPTAMPLHPSPNMNAMNPPNLSTNNPNFSLYQPAANNIFPPPPPPLSLAASGPGPSSTQPPSLQPFLLPPPVHQHPHSIPTASLRTVAQQARHRNRRAALNLMTRGAILGSGSAPLPINTLPQIRSIERIQNQRWFKQYSAHDIEFRQKLGKQTFRWLFHGCDERASKNITMECFNRSYAGQHAVAFGHGCYFAQDSLYSDGFAPPDAQGLRRMFLARVLVGNTTVGNSTMRVAPPGYDSTGDGRGIFVTYHDSQAYAEYLITYQR